MRSKARQECEQSGAFAKIREESVAAARLLAGTAADKLKIDSLKKEWMSEMRSKIEADMRPAMLAQAKKYFMEAMDKV